MTKLSLARISTTFAESLRSYWQGPVSLRDPALASYFNWSPPTSSGVAVNESTALSYSAFWSAVQLIAGDVSTLPLHLFERLPNGGRRRVLNHPLARVLDDRANSEMTSLSVREVVTTHTLATGNGFCEIIRDQLGRVQQLHPLTPDRVEPFRPTLGGGRVGPLWYRIDGQVVLDANNVFHLHGLSWDGIVGKSVVSHARESIGLSLAAERMGGSFFSNGLHLGGFLRHPGRLTKDAKQAIRESVAARHAGVGNAHQTLILEDGLEYQSIGLSPEDSQFIESRQFQVAEIARWFNLPPTKLADFSKATYSNTEQSAIDYYTSCLRRWLMRWESEIQLKLISASEQSTLFAEHKVDAILKGDIKTRYDAYGAGRAGGWLSMNDIRRLENLDPVAGGDTYLVPLNMQTIGGSAEPTRDKPEPLFRSQGQASVMLTATRDVLVDQLGRYVRRECERARRAQATPAKLRAFVENFYTDQMQRDLWVQMMKPGLRMWHALAGLDVDIDQACTRLVDRHFDDSKRELLAIADLWADERFGEALQRKLQTWEEDRAQRVVDHLIQHGVPASATTTPAVDAPSPTRGMSLNMLEKWHRTQLARHSTRTL